MIQEVHESDWDETLLSCGLDDVYLSRGYVHADSTIDEAKPLLLLHRGERGGVAFPLLLRNVPSESGLADVASPQGYGGPIGFGEAPPWSAFHDSYDLWCQQNRVIATFVRFHPRFGNHRMASPSMTVERLAGTVGWRIARGRDLLAQMHAHHRRSSRIAGTHRLNVVQSEVDAEAIKRFRALYAATMRRVDAASYYDFPDAYWQNLHIGLGSQLVVAEARDEDGTTLSAALLLNGRPWLHYHLGGSTEDGRRLRANVLLFLEVAITAQEDRFQVFHLGGGVGGSADSLLMFKQRFDPGDLLEAAIGKQIHDPAAYHRLVGSLDTAGYFPAYRASERP